MKVLSQETSINTTSTVSNATVVRIFNGNTSDEIVTRTDSNDNIIGKLTVPSKEVLYIQKNSTDKLSASNGVLASKIAYTSMMHYASYPSTSNYVDGNIVTSNLIYHLDANNSSSYNGSGTKWKDLIGGGDAGIQGPTFTEGTGDNGYYFDFDGVDDFVKIPGVAYTLGQNFTIEVWARNDNSTMTSYGANSGNTVYSSQGDETFTQNNLIHLAQDRAELSLSSGVGANEPIYNPVPSLQTWHQYVVTHTYTSGSSATVKVFIDKVQVVNQSGVKISITNGEQALGRRSDNVTYGSYWDGQISIFRVYSDILTSSEIETNYDANKGRYGLS